MGSWASMTSAQRLMGLDRILSFNYWYYWYLLFSHVFMFNCLMCLSVLPACACTMCVSAASRSQKWKAMPGSLELELGAAVGHHRGVRNWTWTACKSTLNHQALLSAHSLIHNSLFCSYPFIPCLSSFWRIYCTHCVCYCVCFGEHGCYLADSLSDCKGNLYCPGFCWVVMHWLCLCSCSAPELCCL